MEMKFYRCSICGQLIAIVEETGVPLVCCGEDMEQLIPGSVDASHEKHVPVIQIKGDHVTVSVGSAPHPMTQEHSIEWIALETTRGCQFHKLSPDDAPKASYRLCEGDKVKAAYAFCNLHGFWKAETP